jgi:hypothetical protein
MARKMYIFTVEGKGLFPTDMLRYDACYPTHNTSVKNIDYVSLKENRRVTLASANPPTNDRWQSFMWPVIAISRGN